MNARQVIRPTESQSTWGMIGGQSLIPSALSPRLWGELIIGNPLDSKHKEPRFQSYLAEAIPMQPPSDQSH